MLSLPDVTGGDQDHQHLDAALVRGGAHPHLHKLSLRDKPSSSSLEVMPEQLCVVKRVDVAMR